MENNQLLKAISGILTVEQKAQLDAILANADAEPAVAEIEIPFMDSVPAPVETITPTTDEVVEVDGVIYKKATIKEVNNMIDKRNKNAPFGTEKCINRKGEEYTYIRNEWDGKITQLDAKHEEMKKHFIAHSRDLINAYHDFCGAGPDAITMLQPEHKFANKEGKVFYRWTGQHTAELMDELWPLVVPFKTAMEEAVKAVKAKQGEGQ